MQKSEQDELRRAIHRYHELTHPHRVLTLLQRLEELERKAAAADPRPAFPNSAELRFDPPVPDDQHASGDLA